MASFNTVFKKVYGEALELYGFVKLKGKYPYFVKLIGDEIILILTYRNEYSERIYQNFNILGGVMTVYRRKLPLDESPVANSDLLCKNLQIYDGLNQFENNKVEERERFFEFRYRKDREDSEEAMIAAIKHSLEVTKELLLPELLKVTDLKACVEFYRLYGVATLHIYADEDFGQQYDSRGDNESLLNLIVYTPEEYAAVKREIHERAMKEYDYHIRHAQGDDKYKAWWEQRKEESIKQKEKLLSIADFEKLYNDPVQYARVMEELNRRKTENSKILRSYGFEV